MSVVTRPVCWFSFRLFAPSIEVFLHDFVFIYYLFTLFRPPAHTLASAPTNCFSRPSHSVHAYTRLVYYSDFIFTPAARPQARPFLSLHLTSRPLPRPHPRALIPHFSTLTSPSSIAPHTHAHIPSHAHIHTHKLSPLHPYLTHTRPQAILCSCWMPGFSGWVPPLFRGVRYLDGVLSDNLPLLDPHTITVSPFAGNVDICPRDGDAARGWAAVRIGGEGLGVMVDSSIES